MSAAQISERPDICGARRQAGESLHWQRFAQNQRMHP